MKQFDMSEALQKLDRLLTGGAVQTPAWAEVYKTALVEAAGCEAAVVKCKDAAVQAPIEEGRELLLAVQVGVETTRRVVKTAGAYGAIHRKRWMDEMNDAKRVGDRVAAETARKGVNAVEQDLRTLRRTDDRLSAIASAIAEAVVNCEREMALNDEKMEREMRHQEFLARLSRDQYSYEELDAIRDEVWDVSARGARPQISSTHRRENRR